MRCWNLTPYCMVSTGYGWTNLNQLEKHAVEIRNNTVEPLTMLRPTGSSWKTSSILANLWNKTVEPLTGFNWLWLNRLKPVKIWPIYGITQLDRLLVSTSYGNQLENQLKLIGKPSNCVLLTGFQHSWNQLKLIGKPFNCVLTGFNTVELSTGFNCKYYLFQLVTVETSWNQLNTSWNQLKTS